MMGIFGAMVGEGVTGQTLAEQVRSDEELSDKLTTLSQAAKTAGASYFNTRCAAPVTTAAILTPLSQPLSRFASLIADC